MLLSFRRSAHRAYPTIKCNFSFAPNSSTREQTLNLLQVKTFSPEELDETFVHLKSKTKSDGKIVSTDRLNLSAALQELILKRDQPQQVDIDKITKFVSSHCQDPKSMNAIEFRNAMISIGNQLDVRVWSLGVSFLLSGISVGIIIPCMPLLVTALAIPASYFGLVISSFGLSKLIGNIPSGYFVEKYGRKASIVTGLGMCGVGIGSIGMSLMPGLGVPWLIGCRFVTGLGVSAFVAGGFMYASGERIIFGREYEYEESIKEV
jgi:hypothetical protein